MLLAIAIAILQQVTFLSYLMDSAFFTRATNEETHALMVGVAIFTAIMSVPATVWNISMVKDQNEKKDILGAIISVITFVLSITFLVISFVVRLYSLGRRLF